MDKVIKLAPNNSACMTPLEVLEMAIEDIKSGNFEPKKMIISSDDGRYSAGLKNNYEAMGLIYDELNCIANAD